MQYLQPLKQPYSKLALCAINSKLTKADCELLLEMAVKCEIAKILEGKVGQ